MAPLLRTSSPSKIAAEGSSPTAIESRSKWRKPSYVARKENKAKLLEEIAALQLRIEELRDAQRQREDEARLEAVKLQESNAGNQLAAHVLREAVKLQQQTLVNLQSAISAYMSTEEAIPHRIALILGHDQSQRRRALIDFRHRNTAAALDYLQSRTRHVDPFRPYAENLRSLLESGDFCALHLSSIPLDGPHATVKQVFDVVVGYLSDLEMRITDVLGDITTRDDVDYGMEGLQQSRFVSRLSCGMQLEMNAVTSWEFSERNDEHGNGGPFGVVTISSVEQDALYPYQPEDRVRQDINVVLTVRAQTRERFNESVRRWEHERVIVWTRASYAKLRPTLEPLPIQTKHRLREQLGKWGDDMERAVMEQVLLSTDK